jgi:hypothetical protein
MGTPLAAPSAPLISGHGARLFGARRAAVGRRRGAARALPTGKGGKGVARAVRLGWSVGRRRQSVSRGSVSQIVR